jgi:hypothetical protein
MFGERRRIRARSGEGAGLALYCSGQRGVSAGLDGDAKPHARSARIDRAFALCKIYLDQGRMTETVKVHLIKGEDKQLLL